MSCPTCTYEDDMVRFDVYKVSSTGEGCYHYYYQVLDPKTDHRDIAEMRRLHNHSGYIVAPNDARSAWVLAQPDN